MAIAIFLISFVACGGNGPTQTTLPSTYVGYGNDAVFVVVEGIRCIVVDGYESVAISCDWSER